MITRRGKGRGRHEREEPGLIAVAHPGEISGSRSRRPLQLSEMVVHPWTRAEICSSLRISPASVRSGSAAAGLAILRSNDCRRNASFGERHRARARRQAQRRVAPPDGSLIARCRRPSPAREEAFSRVQGERDTVGVRHVATLLQRGAIGALGIRGQSGLQITAAEPQASRAPFPRRARDVQRVAVGRGSRVSIVLPKLARFAFTLRARELRAETRRSRAAVLPRQDHAVLRHHGSDEDDRRVRRQTSARLADQAVDFLRDEGPADGRSVRGAAGQALRAAAPSRAARTARSPDERRGRPAG